MRLILGDPDPRTPREIARDIDDELAFHLEMIERELHAEGRGEREAKEEARRRFGDVERVRRACAQIALKERAVLQRVNLVLIVVVGALALAALYTQWQGQRSTLAAIEDIKGRLDRLPAAATAASGAGANGGTAGGDAQRAAMPGTVFVVDQRGEGKPGMAVALPTREKPWVLTVLGRIFGELSPYGVVRVSRVDERGEYTTVRLVSIRRLRADRDQDIELRDGDRVEYSHGIIGRVSGDVLAPSSDGSSHVWVWRGDDVEHRISDVLVSANHFPSQVASLTRISSDRGKRVVTKWSAGEINNAVLNMVFEPGDEFVVESRFPELAKAERARERTSSEPRVLSLIRGKIANVSSSGDLNVNGTARYWRLERTLPVPACASDAFALLARGSAGAEWIVVGDDRKPDRSKPVPPILMARRADVMSGAADFELPPAATVLFVDEIPEGFNATLVEAKPR